MARKRVRLALIGCGGFMRQAHVPRYLEDGAVDLVSVCDPDEANAERVMEQWGQSITYYADYRQMLRREQLDAVAIASPHHLHNEHVRLALSRRLHVLCEKPLAIKAQHCRSLVALAKKQKCILVVSYQRHHLAPYRHVRQIIQRDGLGELRGVVGYVTQNWLATGGWRLKPTLSGGGMFIDTGSHLVAIILWLTGLAPTKICAFSNRDGTKVDINTVVNVQFRGGAVGTINTLGNATLHDERVAIHGSKGCIVSRLHQWQLKSIRLNDKPLTVPARVADSTPDADFLKWIRNGGKGYEWPEFAVQVARLTEATYKAAHLKRPVSLSR